MQYSCWLVPSSQLTIDFYMIWHWPHMTLIQIESQNSVLKINFSLWTGKNGDIWQYTGPLGGQNAPEFVDKHLNTSAPTMIYHKIGFFIL